jgi:lipopolysaccharide transport system ATP-binding protein
MPTAIKFENISKEYRLGLVSTQTLSHDLHRWWQMNIRGKDDPYLKIGEVNDRATKGESDYVWALRDINFEVQQGDVLGIIGKNGAGKSTLLKILSKVTAPTTGTIRARGRIASLLEVGTGFHPEMTGRENIFMNGAIMGMTKAEIKSKLDEIIDFSGVERYIDTPVKRYSSGMTVRLGFAIAAHLDPEILVVDEVLAVGDAEFQKKAIGKMQDVSRGEGRTVLFVSHNMGAIQQLCKNICVLKNGTIDYKGNVDLGIDYYLNSDNLQIKESINQQIKKMKKDDDFILEDIRLEQNGKVVENYLTTLTLNVYFSYSVLNDINLLRVGFDIINAKSGIVVFRTYHDDNHSELKTIHKGRYISKATIPANFFLEDNYILSVSIGIHNERWIIYDQIRILLNFNNINGINKLYFNDSRPGIINPLIYWESNINSVIH